MRKQNRPLDTSEMSTILQAKLEGLSVRMLLQRDGLVLQGYTKEEATRMVLETTNGKETK